uniref:Ran GTPase-activating protein 1 n=1 Tax=Kwoniella pini CBS 10737 TaxID=1296096 RepID=A0A1B9I7S8_9TREE|nr:ran GTPase-activating protein 1 [Kwoniella pini CBS 10737]OCF51536.1 ran GTPase-activating protein 1 [Kwoniella pini CBS 10737]
MSKSFSILGKNLKANTADDLQPYLSELEAMEDVEEVHFGANSLGVEACEAIAKVLKNKKNLKIVDLADIFTGRLISEIPQALSALCNALSDSTSLVELDLSDNAFGGRCADAMVPFLENNTNFSIFKLNNNGLGPIGGSIIAKALIKNGEKCKLENKKESNLQILVCGRNRLENGSSKDWKLAFENHLNLKEIKMPQNGIRMEGIKNLVEGLSNCKKLELLDLQDNTATKKGTRAIVKSLKNWKNLKHLNLSDCLLGKTGGISLTTCLSNGSNPNLQILKLQYNEMDKKSIEILSIAITQHLKDLKELELNGNRFNEDDECVEELKKALEIIGQEDALDELDDMEEPESGDEEDESAEEDEDEDEEEEKDEDAVDKGADGSNALPPVTEKQTDE